MAIKVERPLEKYMLKLLKVCVILVFVASSCRSVRDSQGPVEPLENLSHAEGREIYAGIYIIASDPADPLLSKFSELPRGDDLALTPKSTRVQSRNTAGSGVAKGSPPTEVSASSNPSQHSRVVSSTRSHEVADEARPDQTVRYLANTSIPAELGFPRESESSSVVVRVVTPGTDGEGQKVVRVGKLSDIPIGSGESVIVKISSRDAPNVAKDLKVGDLHGRILVEAMEPDSKGNLVITLHDQTLELMAAELAKGNPIYFDGLDRSILESDFGKRAYSILENPEELNKALASSVELPSGSSGTAYRDGDLVVKLMRLSGNYGQSRPDSKRSVQPKDRVKLREIAALLEQSCSSCLPYIGAIQHGDIIFLVSRYAAKGDFADFIPEKDQPLLTHLQLLEILDQVRESAERRVVDIDLKADNFVGEADASGYIHWKKMDWGFAFQRPTKLVSGGTKYSAGPEVAGSFEVDEADYGRVMAYPLAKSLILKFIAQNPKNEGKKADYMNEKVVATMNGNSKKMPYQNWIEAYWDFNKGDGAVLAPELKKLAELLYPLVHPEVKKRPSVLETMRRVKAECGKPCESFIIPDRSIAWVNFLEDQ